MKLFFKILLFITGFMFIKLVIDHFKKQKIKSQEELRQLELETEERRENEINTLIELQGELNILNSKFENLLNYQQGYFNNNKLVTWKSLASELYNTIAQISISQLNLELKYIEPIDKFKKHYSSGEALRKQYNKEFIQFELKECAKFFSNIDAASLDEQQRMAVIKDEDHNLIIAGAGSGKTTTVAGKVAYVINRFKVKPEEILLITFTKKASDEMKERIRKKMGIDIEVNTFHSFGRKVIGQVTKKMPSVIEEKEFYSVIRNIFNTLFNDNYYANNVIKFITEYRLEPKEASDFKSHGDYINYIKENNIRSYKTIEVQIKGKPTLMREYCKSLEEVQIANYLFLNSINYNYEAEYKYPTADSVYAQYKPDFYLPDYDIYIEHFGLIDRDNNVPNWFSGSIKLSAKEKYNTEIVWKRNTHANFKTTLVETYSYENTEGNLLNNLKEKLEKKGVVFKQRSNDEIWKILNEIAKEEISALDILIKTFLNLFKSNNFKIDDLTELIKNIKNKDIKKRYSVFLQIFIPILNKYNEYLKSKNLIDFSDMINDASKYIAANKFENKLNYIIIDEFQDTSIGRFNLINALLKNNTSCKLFAVGDDWQSIYRFAGSDISLFTQFEKYFGVTEYSKIETTYRFSKSMIDISSKFILANPNQTPKQLRAFKNETINPIEIITSESLKNDDITPFIIALKKINSEVINENKKIKILALSRFNNAIELYRKTTDLFSVHYNNVEECYTIKYLPLPHLEIQFLSVHRSKGLQADYVIVLNCISGEYGFPSEQADDPILNLLLSKSDQFENGEERRLFYVALTRSKRKTFITTNSTYKSKFISEIDPNQLSEPQKKCPICKKGNLIKKPGINKKGNPYNRYTCSNKYFGCRYVAWG